MGARFMCAIFGILTLQTAIDHNWIGCVIVVLVLIFWILDPLDL